MTATRDPQGSGPDTIVAISTPPGEGAIGIVRLSGPEAVPAVTSLFASSSGRRIDASARRVFHGEIVDDGEVLDEVLVHVMRAPHSYTREDVVEINCHGGAGPVRAVLEAVLRRGVRLAEPGEFTKRAFLNGRLDLPQAEAVLDRIRAQTRAALHAAADAAHGALSKAIHAMDGALVDALARVEAAVDFPEEDLPELVDQALWDGIRDVRARMEALLATSERGRLLREGARIGIAGRPNVGKSSLFNALLRDARAIVTEHAGTTRDLIEEVITINGIPVRLTDTAGLRDASNEVERLGIAAAREALRNAHAMLLVVDAAEPRPEDPALLDELRTFEAPIVLALNKSDLRPDAAIPSWAEACDSVVRVSALRGDGLNELEDALGRLLIGGAAPEGHEAMVTQAHQRDSLRRAAEAVDRLLAAPHASPEFLSIDLRDAIDALGEITGETTPDDVLGRIFSSFCIGK